MSSFGTYVVQQGDSIEGIAQRLLRDRSRWRDLVALNRLRYPFLSDDPADQLGRPLLTTSLSVPFHGGLVLQLVDYDQGAYASGNYVLLSGTGGALGQQIWDLTTIFGWGRLRLGYMQWSSEMQAGFTAAQLAALPQQNLLYLVGVPNHTYGSGAPVAVYADPALQRSFVLGTGMLLRLPADASSSNVLLISDSEYRDLLGTDLALGRDGTLSLALRDLATVSGVDNLAQALRIRLTTELGELIRYPDYGNALLARIGSTDPSLRLFAYAEVSRAVLADPRIERLRSLSVDQAGDALRVSVAANLRGRLGLLELDDLVIRPR